MPLLRGTRAPNLNNPKNAASPCCHNISGWHPHLYGLYSIRRPHCTVRQRPLEGGCPVSEPDKSTGLSCFWGQGSHGQNQWHGRMQDWKKWEVGQACAAGKVANSPSCKRMKLNALLFIPRPPPGLHHAGLHHVGHHVWHLVLYYIVPPNGHPQSSSSII